MYLCGANRVAFDFADCGRTRVSEAQHFWLARQYDVPAYSWFRLSALEGGQDAAACWTCCGSTTAVAGWISRRCRWTGISAARNARRLRTSWEPDAMMVGIQAGDSMNLGGHRHLDLGSFIVDARGERWIMDSGVEHETYMTHRNKTPRPSYYRVRAEGHNVPVLNPDKGPDQNPKRGGEDREVRVHAAAGRGGGRSQPKPISRMRIACVRTFTLADRKRLIVTDELQARQPAELWWFLHTEAKVKLNDGGRTAVLSQHGKTFTVRLQEPAGAAFQVMDCRPLPSSLEPEPQADNRGRRKLPCT